MIPYDVEQGSPEWWELRLGIPTASDFKKIVTTKLESSQQANGYMNKLIGESLANQPDETFQSDWMKRGHELEPEARDYYSFSHDVECVQIGFCKANCKRYGCSPDALINEDGGLEIKCVSRGVYVGYLRGQKLPSDHMLQVYGSLLVTGREWWDFMAYYPGLKPFIIRTEREKIKPELINLAVKLNNFCDKLDKEREVARNLAA